MIVRDPATPSVSKVDRATAVAAAANAATAWFGEAPRVEALATVMHAMSLVGRVAPDLLARKPHEFIEVLRLPLAEWLGGGEDELLVEHDRPTSYCVDLVDEAGDDPAAELAQARVGASRAIFALRDDGDRGYRAFRLFLATHGHPRRLEAMRGVAASSVDLADLYEVIPGDCRFLHDGEECLIACPRCSWPMRVDATNVECASSACRADGARYRRQPSGLVPLGSRTAPIPIAIADRVRLRRGVWRYTLLPGLVELDLARRLEAIAGTAVELWPQRDRYDLLVHRGDRTWRVDVKDWSSPVSLARSLQRRGVEDGVWIVIPEHRARHVDILADRCCDLRCRFATVRTFIEDVEQESRA